MPGLICFSENPGIACLLGSFLLFHVDEAEREQKIKQLVRVGQIRLQKMADPFQTVQQSAAVDKKLLGCPGGVLVVFQIAAESLVELGLAVFRFIFQIQKLLVTYHVCGKLFCGLFQKIGQGNIVKAVDPSVGEFTASHLERKRCLYILAVKIKMSQHPAAVSCIEKAVPDETGKLLFNFSFRKLAKIQIDVYDNISLMFQGAGSGDDIFYIADNGPVGQVFII